MNAPPPRRWSIAFISRRWRHLLWATPVFAILCGAAFHFGKQRRDYAVAVIQILPRATSGAPTPPIESLGIFTSIRSTEVLGAAVDECSLDTLWKLDRSDSIIHLRGLVDHEPIKGTALIKVKVVPIPGADAARVCGTIVERAKGMASADQQEWQEATLASLKAQVEALEAELEEARKALSDARKVDRSSFAAPPADPNLRLRYEALRDDLKHWKLKEISDQMNFKVMESPNIIREAPRWQSATLTERLGSAGPVLRSSIAAGIILAILLSYLAEALLPRKPLPIPPQS
ncbi:hypothetical protein [Luteolibacter sp. Populi]|uniref:hypothetical protein n=1 Tax=Luteolibacter sp. Populi TaxID=3230487 RepID=UPI0034671563